MTRICCVPACKSNYPSTLKTDGKVALFKFPTKNPLRQAWLTAINKKNFQPTHCSFVCIKHFNKRDIIHEKYHGSIIIPYKYPRLIPNIVPSIFPGSSAQITKANKRKPRKNNSKQNKEIIDDAQSFSNTSPTKKHLEEENCEILNESGEEVSTTNDELIESFAKFKLSVASRLKDYNVEIKSYDEDVYLYNINLLNFTISRYIRISKELNGYFFPQSRSFEMLDQQFTYWSEIQNAVKLFFIDSFDLPADEKIHDLLNLLSDRTNDLIMIAKSSGFKYCDTIDRIKDEFKTMLSNHNSTI